LWLGEGIAIWRKFVFRLIETGFSEDYGLRLPICRYFPFG
jgi:hypothetical protein